VLDELLRSSTQSVKVIRVEFGKSAYLLDNREELVFDGTVPRADFVCKLLDYVMKGLKIVDEEDRLLRNWI
jgi:hypothetical protein